MSYIRAAGRNLPVTVFWEDKPKKPSRVKVEELVRERRWDDFKQKLQRLHSPRRLGKLLFNYLLEMENVPLDVFEALFAKFDQIHCDVADPSFPISFDEKINNYLHSYEVHEVVFYLDGHVLQILLNQYGSLHERPSRVSHIILQLWLNSMNRSPYQNSEDIEAAVSSITSIKDLALSSNQFWASIWEKTIGLYRLSLHQKIRYSQAIETLPFVSALVEWRAPKVVIWLALRLYPNQAAVTEEDSGKIPLHRAILDHYNRAYYTPTEEQPRHHSVPSKHRSIIEVLLDVSPEGAKCRDAKGLNTLDLFLESYYFKGEPYRPDMFAFFQNDVMALITSAPEILIEVNPTHQLLPFMLAAGMAQFPEQTSETWLQKLNLTYTLLRKDPSVLRRIVCADPASKQIQELYKQLQVAQETIKKQKTEIVRLQAAATHEPRKAQKTISHGALPPGSRTMLLLCLLLGWSAFVVVPTTAFWSPASKPSIHRAPLFHLTCNVPSTQQFLTVTRVSVALDLVQTSSSSSRSFEQPHNLSRRMYKAKIVGKPPQENGKDPVDVEAFVNAGIDALGTFSEFSPSPSFPSVRECNSALSAFGDQGDLLRALRLFGKMRKAAYLQRSIQRQIGVKVLVPTPTLVTYSTLMSRAVRAGKPHVALRLWKMMPSSIEPDVKSINILLNCYAKLGNAQMAKDILNGMEQEPNLVTFNTVLKACQNVGDLDGALEIKNVMQELSVRPDVWTYTTLLATVARGKSRSSGERDPTIALHLLQEMHKWKVYPNGMTYSAFIEACGRCGRVDLALQGLRVMQRQKDREKQRRGLDSFALSDEVGAWTSAINVCGKAGRWETAVKLFGSMKRLGCAPNTVTCGCLADSLLRCGRTAETLGVLRYMKKEGILPTEVMYTSLMTRADSLIQMENEFTPDRTDVAEESDTKAIEVYTELMMSLMEIGEKRTTVRSPKNSGHVSDSNTRLLKVFLVFQQMKAAGAEPDLACFNVLLRACASAGDVARGWDVLRQIQSSPRLEPNDRSWRELLRAAATAGDAKKAETVWEYGLSYHLQHPRFIDEPEWQWKPSIKSLQNLLVAYSRQADIDEDKESRRDLYERVIQTYDGILMGERHMGLQRIDPMEMLDDRRTILIILRAILSLKPLVDATRLAELQVTGRSLIQLDCLDENPPLNPSAERLVHSMRTWASLQI